MKEAAEIKKIPCAVCRDLMPLVQDGVASPESEELVKAHLPVSPASRCSNRFSHTAAYRNIFKPLTLAFST